MERWPVVRTWMVVVAALVASVVGGGVGWWLGHRADEADRRPLTLVVGDSVTRIAQSDIEDALRSSGQPHDHVVVAARSGFTAADILPLARQAADESAEQGLDRVAILIGYNDARLGSVDTPALDDLVALAGRFRCGVLLTLPTVQARSAAFDASDWTARVRRWNVRLARAAASDPRLHVSNAWRDAVDAPGGVALLDADHVHPGERGRARLAAAYREALDASC